MKASSSNLDSLWAANPTARPKARKVASNEDPPVENKGRVRPVMGRSPTFTDTLTLGYRDAVAVGDSPLHRIGDRVVGHEFHRTAVQFTGDRQPAWRFAGRGGHVVDADLVETAGHE